jgi:two-component system response regulator RegX3
MTTANATPDQTSTILLVEDDASITSVVAYRLRRDGFGVLTATNGEAGLSDFRAHGDAIDLVLLDLMLPGLSGFHILRAIRAQSNVPVLVLTARGEVQDKLDSFDLGADDYLVKPFNMQELIARIRTLIRRANSAPAAPASVVTRGAIQIDTRAQRVLVNGAVVSLRRKEYGLLLLLAMDPDRLFRRQDILDKIWGTDVIVDDRTVDVHISWLRGKLQRGGLQIDPIQTAYGSGYRFSSALAASNIQESRRETGETIQAAQAGRLDRPT